MTVGAYPSRRQYESATDLLDLSSTLSGQDNDELTPPIEVNPRERGITANLPRRVFGVDRLIDIPIFRLTAMPWTSVTDDDDLVSHLVSLYATWEHVFFDGLVLDLFLRDMQMERVDAPFCSPFLVNCILATACPYSDFDEVRTQLGRNSRLMHLFVDHAESMLSQAAVRSPLTTVQGLTILALTAVKQNQQARSQIYIRQALTICSDLSQKRNSMIASTTADEQAEFLFCLETSILGAFRVASVISFGYRLSFTPPAPQWILPINLLAARQLHTSSWVAYPAQSKRISSLYMEAAQLHVDLAAMESAVSGLVYAEHGLDEAGLIVRMRSLDEADSRLSTFTDRIRRSGEAYGSSIPICLLLLM